MSTHNVMMQKLSSPREISNIQYPSSTMQQQSPTSPYHPVQGQYRGNMDADMYLQPSNNNNSYMREKPLQRNVHEHDSGVLDVDHIQPDLDSLAGTPRNSNTSGGTPRNSNTSVHSPSLPVPPYNRHNQALPPHVVPPMNSKRPESLAVKGHEYEELPGQKYLNSQYTYPELEGYVGQPTPPRSVKFGGSKENLCHSGSNGSMMSDRPPPPVYRKRHNPLYEEEKDAMVPKKSKAQSGLWQCPCPCLAILIFCVLSLVTFILVILLMTGVVSTSDSNSNGYPRTGASTGDNNYSVEYNELEAKYQELLQKLNQLETETKNKNNAIDNRVVQLEDKVVLIDNEIDTVSKMQGPRGFNGSRGPPGAGDLSQCGHDTRSGGAAAVAEVTTTWYPQQKDQGRVIMGLYCSHNYETPAGTYLETRENGGVTQYRCFCGPMTNPPENINTHSCKLHIWYCPETS